MDSETEQIFRGVPRFRIDSGGSNSNVRASEDDVVYGTVVPEVDSAIKLFESRRRWRLSSESALASMLLPWIFFLAVLALASCSLHYLRPAMGKFIFALSIFPLLAATPQVGARAFRKFEGLGVEGPPSWVPFVYICCLVAWVSGAALGTVNFRHNVQPYLDYVHMHRYADVDPSRTKGQQLMDSGVVSFVPGASLDLQRSMRFVSSSSYCVAPITVYSAAAGTHLPLGTYDFWAVGINCCDDGSAAFRCPNYDNRKAHFGLRFLSDDARQYFRLAVRQAEAAYAISSPHPLFFHWVSDPRAAHQAFLDASYKFFMIAMLVSFAIQCVAVGAMSRVFAKLRQPP